MPPGVQILIMTFASILRRLHVGCRLRSELRNASIGSALSLHHEPDGSLNGPRARGGLMVRFTQGRGATSRKRPSRRVASRAARGVRDLGKVAAIILATELTVLMMAAPSARAVSGGNPPLQVLS